MKKRKNHLEKQLVLFFIIFAIIASCSCRKDTIDEIDITKWTWKLKSVTTNNETFKPQKNEYFRDNAYILDFENDSTFLLNTSVNYAGGIYKIVNKGVINIFSFNEFTKVGTVDNSEKELNNNLLAVFREVTTYEVLGNILTFKGSKGEVEFKKE